MLNTINLVPFGSDPGFAFCFPSKKAMEDLYQSGKFNEINAHRIAGIDATLAVLSTPQKMPPKTKN